MDFGVKTSGFTLGYTQLVALVGYRWAGAWAGWVARGSLGTPEAWYGVGPGPKPVQLAAGLLSTFRFQGNILVVVENMSNVHLDSVSGISPIP